MGAQGLPLERGVDIQVSDSPGRFADAVVRLLSDFDACIAQRERACNRLRGEFGPAAVRLKVADLMDRVSQVACQPLPAWRRWARRGRCALDERLLWRFGVADAAKGSLDRGPQPPQPG